MATHQNTTRARPVSLARTDSRSRLVPSDAFSRLLEMDDGINPKEPKITHHSARLKKSHRSADFISVGRKEFGPSSISVGDGTIAGARVAKAICSRSRARARNSSVESSRANRGLPRMISPGPDGALVGDLAAARAGPWSELDAVIRCRDEHLIVLDRQDAIALVYQKMNALNQPLDVLEM
jgi:hypothetical protein